MAVAIYHGESGYSGCTRDIDHKTDLEKRRKKCDFYYYGETSEFSMSMVSTTTKHFIRKIRDDIEIVAGIRDILRKSCKQNQNFFFRREDPLSVLNWTGGDLPLFVLDTELLLTTVNSCFEVYIERTWPRKIS